MCAILMYSFQSHLCSLLFASSLSAFFIYIFFVVCTVSNFFSLSLSLLAILCAYIYLCLVSTLEWYFAFRVFFITEFVQCSFIWCLCAVSFISSSCSTLPLFFVYQPPTQTERRQRRKKSWLICVRVCMSVFQFNTIMDFSHFCKKKKSCFFFR